MNRKTLVRGIQIIVVITLATLAYRTYVQIVEKKEGLAAGFATLKPWWLVVAAACALQEGVFGGVRMWFLGRVVATSKISIRTTIISEFVLMFCAGVSPLQLAGPPSQIAVLMNGGMRFVEVATAELVIGVCTILLFLGCAVAIFVMKGKGLLVVSGGAEVDALVWLSVIGFGSVLLGLLLCAFYPPLLKAIFRGGSVVFGPVYRVFLRLLTRTRRFGAFADRRLAARGELLTRLLHGVDDFHRGFGIYLRRGKLAFLAGLLTTVGFFGSRFAAAYFILLGLGIPTTPQTFVCVGPAIFQVVMMQALLNFALYLSPTPGASGVAELGSGRVMRPWVHGVYEVPYLVLWRVLTLFLCMFVGGVFVFRYLGTDVLEEKVKEQEAEKKLLEGA